MLVLLSTKTFYRKLIYTGNPFEIYYSVVDFPLNNFKFFELPRLSIKVSVQQVITTSYPKVVKFSHDRSALMQSTSPLLLDSRLCNALYVFRKMYHKRLKF